MSVTIKIVFHPDMGLIEKHFSDGAIRTSMGRSNGKGYMQSWVNGKMQYTHRLIWEHVHGPIPDGMQIDHINGVKSDNRIANLRLVTKSQNQQNTNAQVNNHVGVKGVSWNKTVGKWTAQIGHEYKIYTLGKFSTIEEARAAYAGAAALLHTHNPHAS